MVSVIMITGFRRPLLWVTLGVLVVGAVACQRVALLAPAGSTITLTTLASALPLSGTTSLIAQVIEPAGTPPQRGTLVTFTTSLGTIEPVEAETDAGGRVLVTFKAGPQSGTATITALSGGVTTGSTGAIKIAIGAAAVATLAVTANPPTIGPGGKSTITATTNDSSGAFVAGIPVTFTSDNGSLNPAVATTDANGNATTVLTTSRTAKVTATSGASTTTGTTTTPAPTATVTVTVDPAPVVSITASPSNPTAGSTTTFTISAQPGTASSASIQNLTVSFGDGNSRNLGATQGSGIQVQHVYQNSGSYQATASATDTNGSVGTGSTVIFVGGATANFTSAQVGSAPTAVVTFNASSSTSSGGTITTYTWNFGDPASGGNNTGAGVVASHTYATAGSYTVTLTITDSAGRTATTQRTITVT
jgi:hypothetical protein